MSWHSSGFTDVDKLLFSVMALNRYIYQVCPRLLAEP